MKRILNYSSVLVFSCCIFSCGKPTESRVQMDYIAQRTSDSLLNSIDSLLKEPERDTLSGSKALITPTYIFEYK